MAMELLMLTPYAAIAAGLLLIVTIAMTCHMHAMRRRPGALSDSTPAYGRPARTARRPRPAIMNSQLRRGSADCHPANWRKRA